MEPRRPTREQIHSHVEANPGVSAEELCVHFNCSRPNILYHIRNLVRRNKVYSKTVVDSVKMSRGRPRIGYHPVCAVTNASEHLLSQLLFTYGDDDRIEAWIERATISDTNGVLHKDNPVIRLNHLTSELTKLGYQARWEVTRKGIRVILDRCPFSSILCTVPIICRYDISLLKNTTQSEIRVINTRTINKSSPCVFMVDL